MKNKLITAITFIMMSAAVLTGCGMSRITNSGGSAGTGTADTGKNAAEASDTAQQEGRMEQVTYKITYDNRSYTKEAEVYVPASYDGSKPMNIFYLLHGSNGSGQQLSEDMKPLFDQWISDGSMAPMLVVFPTYYPDESFVVPDYTADYPLNHFFATQEVNALMTAVEGKYKTFVTSTDAAGLAAGRSHRAFGGYSMGGITTWEVLAYQSRYFAYFMPMAGDSWIDRSEDLNTDADTADFLLNGMEKNGYTSDDFRIIAMVGGNDGTKYSMQPQIEALRKNHTDLINDRNLIYWENKGGGHSLESLEAEVHYGLPYLFQ